MRCDRPAVQPELLGQVGNGGAGQVSAREIFHACSVKPALDGV
jgi:hypothetical protein